MILACSVKEVSKDLLSVPRETVSREILPEVSKVVLNPL